MSINFSELEDKLVSALRDSGLIERFSISEISKTPDLAIIINQFEKLSIIDFDDRKFIFL